MRSRTRRIALTAVIAMLACAGRAAIAQQAGPAGRDANAGQVQSTQDARLQQAQQLEDQFVALFAAHRYAEAVPLAQQTLRLREDALGPTHELVGRSCLFLGAALQEVNDSAAAQHSYERALRIAEATIGPDHMDIVTILMALAVALGRQGYVGDAMALEERILRITEKNYGPDDLRLAAALAASGSALKLQGQLATARTRLERALGIYEKALGPNHRDVARTIFRLAIVVEGEGDYAAARRLYERALQIYENVLGPENSDVAGILGKLGDISKDQGDFGTAQQLLERALKMSEKVSGADNTDVASALGRLGKLYADKGNYVAARPLLERALRINEKVYGPEHPFIATELNDLATLVSEQGDYSMARKLHERALNLFEKAYGPSAEQVATSLNNIAAQYSGEGNYAAAQPLDERALAIKEKIYGPNHPVVAISLNNLALDYVYQGRYASAGPLLERAIRIDERALGPEDSVLAMLLGNLGYYYRLQADYAPARRFYERALTITEKALGPDHPQVANRLINLATVDWQQQDHQAARDRLLRAGHILDTQTRVLLPTLSLAEQSAFISAQVSPQTARLLQTSGDGATLVRAYGLVFRWKGLLVESLRQQTALARLMDDPAYKPTVERLRALRAQVAGWYLKAGSVPFAQWTQQNDNLTREKEAIERELARVPTRAALDDPLRNVDLQAFRAMLESDETLIDIYSNVVFSGDAQRGEHYVAVVTSRSEGPVFVDLGATSTINKAVSRWRSAVLDQGEATNEWSDLAALLWKPLRSALPKDARKLWISPDGELSRFPWQLLFADNPDTAQLLLSQTDSPRALFSLHQKTRRVIGGQEGRLLLAGDIDFNARPGDKKPDMQGSGSFNPLPATALEVRALEKLARSAHLDVMLLTGQQATKGAVVEKLKSARYAHLATHGFFYAETEASSRVQQIASRGVETATTIKDVRNPLVESGLALAGANERDSSTFEARGLLTAEELVGLDLSNIDLVMLSACDTGRGEQITGQGVMGLRASIAASGARSVIMSLWKVPDESTSRLMQAFYTNLWQKKMPPSVALQRAQQSIREDPSGRFKAPIHWAGWVLAGEGW